MKQKKQNQEKIIINNENQNDKQFTNKKKQEIENNLETSTELRENSRIEIVLSEEEKEKINDLKNNLDADSMESIISFGSGAQSSILEISQNFAGEEKTKNIGIVGDYLAQAVSGIKELGQEKPKTLIGRFFKKTKISLSKYKSDNMKINEMFNDISEKCKRGQELMVADSKIWEEIFKKCEESYKNIELYKIALNEKIVEEGKKLEELQKEYLENDGVIDAFEQQKLKIKTDMIKQLEKRYSALCTSQVSLAMSAAQANINYQTGNELVIKLQGIQHDTLPIIQIQTAVALGQAHEKDIANYVTTISDSTQTLLKMSAEESHMISNQVVREAERPLLEKETMEKVTAELVGTIEDIQKITQEGRKKRIDFENALPKMIESLNSSLKKDDRDSNKISE